MIPHMLRRFRPAACSLLALAAVVLMLGGCEALDEVRRSLGDWQPPSGEAAKVPPTPTAPPEAPKAPTVPGEETGETATPAPGTPSGAEQEPGARALLLHRMPDAG